MLSRPPAPALAPAPPELEPPRVSSGRIALRRASHPGEGIPEGIPEGITMEVPDELAERLRHLARARSQPLESLTADLLRRGLDQETRRQQAEDALAGLTPRPPPRGEVARLAVGGQTNRQIARELWLSPETVKTHLRRTLEHFDLHSKAELRLLLLDLDGDPLREAPSGGPRGCKDAMRSATKREARLPGD